MIDHFTFSIPQLSPEMERRAYVCLPEGYDLSEDERYPVLYMFDGQNLFSDEEAAFGVSWGLADYMQETGTPLIIAAIESSTVGDGRLEELSPYTHRTESLGLIRGRARTMLAWMTDIFKPFIDGRYRTIPDREATFIGGSSMGGLMSLYAAVSRSDLYSAAVCLSPSLWTHPAKAVRMVRQSDIPGDTRIYLDYGAEELDNHADNRRALLAAAQALMEKGCGYTLSIIPGADHSEASWARRVPDFMRFLGF